MYEIHPGQPIHSPLVLNVDQAVDVDVAVANPAHATAYRQIPVKVSLFYNSAQSARRVWKSRVFFLLV